MIDKYVPQLSSSSSGRFKESFDINGRTSSSQDFMPIEYEGQAPYMTLRVCDYTESINGEKGNNQTNDVVGVLTAVGDFIPLKGNEDCHLPIGPIYVNGFIIPKPQRNGIFFAPQKTEHGNKEEYAKCNYEWWGKLITDFESSSQRPSPEMRNLLEHCKQFFRLEIHLHNSNRQSESYFAEYPEKAQDLLKDARIPYRADRLLPDDQPRGLEEWLFLHKLAHGAQPIGPPECDILWKRRSYMAQHMPQALKAFIRSIHWTDESRADNALILISHDWSPKTSLFSWLEAVHEVMHTVQSNHRPPLLDSLKSLYNRLEQRCSQSLVEELMVRELSGGIVDIPRKYAGERVSWADQLVSIADQVRQKIDATRQQRTAMLREALAQVHIQGPLPFYEYFIKPDDKESQVVAIAADRSLVFKSNAMPVRVSLIKASDYGESLVLVKSGENISNDLWVMAIFEAVKTLWRENGLSLLADNFITYGVYVCGIEGGLIEYISSASLSSILEEHNGMLFKTKHTNKQLESFVASCAGYTLMTFLLGVGDRHLDNLLLTLEGKLFHVDYTYLFGADPKPFAPPIKLCREMLEAIGSDQLLYFKKLIAAGLAVLQRQPNIILTPIMMGFGPNAKEFCWQRLYSISPKYENTTATDVDADASIKTVSALIDESANALIPQVLETLHKWAQYWKE